MHAVNHRECFTFKNWVCHLWDDKSHSINIIMYIPLGVTLTELVSISHTRWGVESKQTMTQETKMATTINSQASSLAPVDFKLSSSLEDSDVAISVAVEKCQLCGATRRPFYCKRCVETGDFTHSKHRIPER